MKRRRDEIAELVSQGKLFYRPKNYDPNNEAPLRDPRTGHWPNWIGPLGSQPSRFAEERKAKMKIVGPVVVKCTRTTKDGRGTVTDQRETEVKCQIREEDDRKIFEISEGGVTGYESFVITKDGAWCLSTITMAANEGWHACAGTNGSWDAQYISATEMERAFKELKVPVEFRKEANRTTVSLLPPQ